MILFKRNPLNDINNKCFRRSFIQFLNFLQFSSIKRLLTAECRGISMKNEWILNDRRGKKFNRRNSKTDRMTIASEE